MSHTWSLYAGRIRGCGQSSRRISNPDRGGNVVVISTSGGKAFLSAAGLTRVMASFLCSRYSWMRRVVS